MLEKNVLVELRNSWQNALCDQLGDDAVLQPVEHNVSPLPNNPPSCRSLHCVYDGLELSTDAHTIVCVSITWLDVKTRR